MKKTNKALFMLLLLVVLMGGSMAYAATSPSLLTAGDFAVLAGSGIVDSNPSVIVGNAGSSPTPSNGLTGAEVTGTNYTAANAAVAQAKVDLKSAYLNAAGQTPVTQNLTGQNLGGQTLTPGIYSFNSSAQLTGTLTLDGGGDSNAVFIFRMGSTLTTASNSHVTLIGSAQSCNVFWIVGSSATLGTTTTFVGNIMAVASITDNGESTVAGRLLADADNDTTGAVTLNATHVTSTTCSTPSASDTTDTTDTTDTDKFSDSKPHIHVTKKADHSSVESGGETVEYTYKVTNTGSVALSDIHIKDDKCDSISHHSGDKNDNDLLDTDETWKYTCKMKITKETKNTVTVKGEANGETDTDHAHATVDVDTPTPKLPNTGIGPDSQNTPWNSIISVGIIATLSLLYIRRKQII